MPCANRLAGQGRGIPLRLPMLRALAATMKATRREMPSMASDQPNTMALCRESQFTMGAPPCQLNRGINSCAWIDQGLASSANKARLATKTSGMIRLSSRVKIIARRACFGFCGHFPCCHGDANKNARQSLRTEACRQSEPA